MIDRITFINIIRASMVTNRFDYGRRAALDWLAAWPGDGSIIELLSEIELEEAHANTAIERLKKLTIVNPESPKAYDLLAKALRQIGDIFKAPLYEACQIALTENGELPEDAPSWLHAIKAARALLPQGDYSEAKLLAQNALAADPSIPIAAVSALRIELLAKDVAAANSIAEIGHNRWTDCLPFRLILAHSYLDKGDIDRGVEYLHRAVENDPTGEISRSWLGEEHPYKNLWPNELVANLSKPVPAEIVAVLGGNNLTASSSSMSPDTTMDGPAAFSAAFSGGMFSQLHSKPVTDDHRSGNQGIYANSKSGESSEPDLDIPAPEEWEAFQGPDSGDGIYGNADDSIREARIEFERLAAELNTSLPNASEDLRQPAYIVLSSRTRLSQEYSEHLFHSIDEEIQDLVLAIRKRPGWKAYKFYVDDPKVLKQFGLVPVDPGNAWAIKLQIADLDRVLSRRGEMIGAILIVGGHRIVPFHLLPNPTDDDDEEVQSDNPYATTDENYFITEWPIGRFPVDHDPDFLQELIQRSTVYHQQIHLNSAIRNRLQDWLYRKLERWMGYRPKSIGYSASIWKKASLAVFRSIGEPRSLITSPPMETGKYPGFNSRSQYSYFNLHGLEDAPEWFGQRDTSADSHSAIEFPVALSPEDIVNSGRAPNIVFSEACYGAHVVSKQTEEAICLKFMASGSKAVVGSTKISYGSINPPLIAADLLGRLFWEQIKRRSTIGEALRRAKIKLAAEMHERQGFLDGEDQKTLISFVLFGDPLYAPSNQPYRPGKKSIQRYKKQNLNVKTACALGGPNLAGAEASQIPLDRVKSIMANYLPGMDDANFSIHMQTCGCLGTDHDCPTAQLGMKVSNSGREPGDLMLISFSKHINSGNRQHPRFARMTLNSSGQVVKLAVSR